MVLSSVYGMRPLPGLLHRSETRKNVECLLLLQERLEPDPFLRIRCHKHFFINEARHHEQEAHHRCDVACAEATVQTHADMLHKIFRVEQVARNTVPNQRTLAEHAIPGKRSSLVSEEIAELQDRVEIHRQLRSQH